MTSSTSSGGDRFRTLWTECAGEEPGFCNGGRGGGARCVFYTYWNNQCYNYGFIVQIHTTKMGNNKMTSSNMNLVKLVCVFILNTMDDAFWK